MKALGRFPTRIPSTESRVGCSSARRHEPGSGVSLLFLTKSLFYLENLGDCQYCIHAKSVGLSYKYPISFSGRDCGAEEIRILGDSVSSISSRLGPVRCAGGSNAEYSDTGISSVYYSVNPNYSMKCVRASGNFGSLSFDQFHLHDSWES